MATAARARRTRRRLAGVPDARTAARLRTACVIGSLVWRLKNFQISKISAHKNIKIGFKMNEADLNKNSINRFTLVYQKNYWRGFACTVSSISKRSDSIIKIDVITDSHSYSHFEKIKNKYLSPVLKNISFECKSLSKNDMNFLQKFSFKTHFHPSVCYRLFYMDLFECNEPVCYLDTDIVFKTNTLDIGQFVSEDFPISARCETKKDVTGKPYFNAGVIIMNCREKKEELFTLLTEAKRLLPVLSKSSIYLDQDALNIAFENRWKELPIRLNRTPSDNGVALDRCIAHATGSRKPWMLGAGHAYNTLYEREIEQLKLPVYIRYDVIWPLKALKRRVNSLMRSNR